MSAPTTRKAIRGLAGLVAATSLAFALAMPAFASHVTPTPISDDNNPTCGDFGAWLEVKSDPPGNETIEVEGFGEIVVSGFENNSFDWSSDFGIDAVLVKAGDDKHNLYVYSPESMGDTDLVPQAGQGNGISHISFCYDETGDETPPPTPAGETPPDSEETPPDSDETPAGETATATATSREDTAGGTPAATAGAVPNTAAQPWTGVPASVLGLLLLASLGAVIYVRLAQDPTKR
jgi:hypothetical protein